MADWDVNKPADDDVISQYPANARSRRSAVQTIFGVEHHATDDANQGKHEVITLMDEAADPTFAAGQVGIWNNAGVLKTRVAAGTAGTLALLSQVQGVLNAPTGTKMPFQQTAAPTGWTKDTTHNNKALRVVTGTAGSGGAVAFTTAFASGRTSDSTALSLSQIPAHTHTYMAAHGGGGSALTGGGNLSSTPFSADTGSAGSSTGHTHGLPSFAVSYVDLIIATKDA